MMPGPFFNHDAFRRAMEQQANKRRAPDPHPADEFHGTVAHPATTTEALIEAVYPANKPDSPAHRWGFRTALKEIREAPVTYSVPNN